MGQSLSFEEMPDEILRIGNQLDTILSILNQEKPDPRPVELDQLMGVKETANFLGLSVQTIYGKVGRNEIPYMKRAKKLYFSKQELLDHLKRGKCRSNLEIQDLANNK